MGAGDEIMATAEARTLWERTRARVRIVDRRYRPRWHDLWRGVPWIVQPGEDEPAAQALTNAPGTRPYIDRRDADRFFWRTWNKRPGAIVVAEHERAWASLALRAVDIDGPFAIIEPHIKSGATRNKDWGFQRWQQVVHATRGTRYVQLGDNGFAPLKGVTRILTTNFRDAVAVLARAQLYVGPEGGLHHAAAALGIQAVVVHGGFIAPAVTGYAGHTQHFVSRHPGDLGCGSRAPCEHCAAALKAITVEAVAASIIETWK